MIIRVTYELKNDVYFVEIQTLEYSASDLELMTKFGEPTVDRGGTFDYGAGQQFVLPCNQVAINGGFPITQSFDGESVPDAMLRANAWASTMVTRISTAVTNLRAQSDTFTRQEDTSV